MIRYIALLFCCLSLCGPTLAAPPPAPPPAFAIPPGPSAAEWTYAAKIEGHTAKTDATLRALASLMSVRDAGADTAKQRAMLGEVRAEAEQGRRFRAPSRFRPVERMYSIAMTEYEEVAQRMSAAIAARDRNAALRSADQMQQAEGVMQRAVTLLHTLERQEVHR